MGLKETGSEEERGSRSYPTAGFSTSPLPKISIPKSKKF
jgi:hypothetical protein